MLSEESGWTGPVDAGITVVLDPVDGSTNCARQLPYWAISLCAVDADGPLVRAGAERRDRRALHRGPREGRDRSTARRSLPSATVDVERAVVALSGWPGRALRVAPVPGARLGGARARATSPPATSTATSTAIADQHAPWDYLGGMLVCEEAGALDRRRSAVARSSVVDADARRQLVAAGTPELLDDAARRDRAHEPTPDLDLDALLDAACRAADAGAGVVLDAFGGARNVREKGPGDWVSDVDTASERGGARGARTTPHPSSRSSARKAAGSGPTSGGSSTRSTAPPTSCTGSPSSACRSRSSPTANRSSAWCTRPMLGDVFAARRGGGAFRNGEPIRVSERARRARDLRDRVSRSGRSGERLPEYLPVFERALLTFEDLRRAGAASLDLVWTAAGVFDGYFEQALGTWDVAAGALLVREAGGVVTDWQGDDRAWLQSGDIVAAPPAVHARILDVIAGSAP